MRYQWRVTKYNPNNRDVNGRYLIDEWTSIHDVGKNYNGKVFSRSEYEAQEEAYIVSVLSFMRSSDIDALKVAEVEGYEKGKNVILDKVNINELISETEIIIVLKAVLREEFWCKLEFEDIFFVHFGYDYIMYVGTSIKCEDCISEVKQNNMFVESIKSPYYTRIDEAKSQR